MSTTMSVGNAQGAGIKGFLEDHVANFVNAQTGSKATASNVNFFIGNEGADADSIISSLCYAYYKCSIDPEKSAPNSCSSAAFVPVVCIERRGLHLRHYVKILLDKVDINMKSLVCLDDLTNSNQSINQDKTEDKSVHRVTILDHNSLNEQASALFSKYYRVKEIIDHHEDMGNHMECIELDRMIAFDKERSAALVASACTLIYEKLVGSEHLNSDIATLLMGVIALDSLNMDEKAGKGTPRDLAALNELQKLTSINRDQLYDELQNAKTDLSFWRELSASDCFLMDYKAFSSTAQAPFSFGMASVALPASELLADKPDLVEAVGKYLFDDQLDAFVIMSFDPRPARELVLFTKSQQTLTALVGYLCLGGTKSSGAVDLSLSVLDVPPAVAKTLLEESVTSVYVRSFTQHNLKASRKQVAPLMQKFNCL